VKSSFPDVSTGLTACDFFKNGIQAASLFLFHRPTLLLEKLTCKNDESLDAISADKILPSTKNKKEVVDKSGGYYVAGERPMIYPSLDYLGYFSQNVSRSRVFVVRSTSTRRSVGSSVDRSL